MINILNFNKRWVNAISFNLAWLGLVTLGNTIIPFVILWLFIHLKYFSAKPHELSFIIIFSIIGISIDSALSFSGIFIFENNICLPAWLIILWVVFSSTFNHSLIFLQKRYALQFMIGALLAPVSYIAGYNLDAVGLGLAPTHTFIILSFIWGPLFILGFYINQIIIEFYANLRSTYVK